MDSPWGNNDTVPVHDNRVLYPSSFHPIGFNSHFRPMEYTSCSTLVNYLQQNSPPPGVKVPEVCVKIEPSSDNSCNSYDSWSYWNPENDSGFADNSTTCQNFSSVVNGYNNTSFNDVQKDATGLLQSAQLAFEVAVQKASNQPKMPSPSWAKRNLPGAGKRTWTVFKPDEIRRKFLDEPSTSLPVDLSVKHTNKSATGSPKNRPVILSKSSPKFENGSESKKSAISTRHIVESLSNHIKPLMHPRTPLTPDSLTKVKEKRKIKRGAADISKNSNIELNKSLNNMEWLERFDNQGLTNSDKGALLTEQQLRKVQTECGSTKRPPFSYMHLVMLAINSTLDKRMTLQDIYRWIETTFPYFKHHAKAGWKNSIRHNLSLYNIFVREPAVNGDDGNAKNKTSYWTIKTDKVGYRRKNKNLKKPRLIIPNGPLPRINVMPVATQSMSSPYMMVAVPSSVSSRKLILPKPPKVSQVPIEPDASCFQKQSNITPSTPVIDIPASKSHPITSTPMCDAKKASKRSRKRSSGNSKNQSTSNDCDEPKSDHVSLEMPHIYLSPSFMDCSSSLLKSSASVWNVYNVPSRSESRSDSGIDLVSDLSSFVESSPTTEVVLNVDKKSRRLATNHRNNPATNNKENDTLSRCVGNESSFDTTNKIASSSPMLNDRSYIDYDCFQASRLQSLSTPPKPKSDALKTSTPHKEMFLTLDASPKWNANMSAFTPLKRITPSKPSTPKNNIDTPPADNVLNTPAQIRLDSSQLESPVTPRNVTPLRRIVPSPARLLNSSFSFTLSGFTPLRNIRQMSGINDSFGDVFPDLQLDDQLLQDNGAMPIDLGNLSWLTNADLTDHHLDQSQH